MAAQPARRANAGRTDGNSTTLTRAEERALRRSAPLTAQQFKELRRLAAQGVSPLRRI